LTQEPFWSGKQPRQANFEHLLFFPFTLFKDLASAGKCKRCVPNPVGNAGFNKYLTGRHSIIFEKKSQ
jgi:hypothetical protein